VLIAGAIRRQIKGEFVTEDTHFKHFQALGPTIDLLLSKGLPCEGVKVLPDGGYWVGKAPTYVWVVEQNTGEASKEDAFLDYFASKSGGKK
jgi:hypothetical protein